MLSKNKIKFINSLKKKKNRTSEKLFIAEGEKIVHELIRSDFKIHSIYSTEDFILKYHLKEDKKVFQITQSELKKISALQTPNQVLALVKFPEKRLNLENIKEETTLALSDINDPGNLGTIIRIADWFGIKNIICSENTADIYNPKSIKASMGSIGRVNIFYRNLYGFLKVIREKTDLTIYGTTLSGKNIYKTRLNKKSIIVLGSESHGISQDIITCLSEQIYIPKFSREATIDSLNVSVAAGIICSEIKKG